MFYSVVECIVYKPSMKRHCLLDDSDNMLSDWLHVPVNHKAILSLISNIFFKEVSFDELGPENS